MKTIAKILVAINLINIPLSFYLTKVFLFNSNVMESLLNFNYALGFYTRLFLSVYAVLSLVTLAFAIQESFKFVKNFGLIFTKEKSDNKKEPLSFSFYLVLSFFISWILLYSYFLVTLFGNINNVMYISFCFLITINILSITYYLYICQTKYWINAYNN